MIRRLAFLLAPSCALSCAIAQPAEPFVEKAAKVQDDTGYVAAFFAVTSGTPTFTFELVDPVSRKYELAFRNPADQGVNGPGVPVENHDSSRRMALIAVPPGDYRVASWWPGTGMAQRLLSPSNGLTTPFAVRPGHVVFLGNFSADETFERTGNLIKTTRKFNPELLPADEVEGLIARAYPGFAQAPLSCLLCKPSDGATRVTPAPPESGGFSGKPDVVIHLRRPADGAVACILSAWETFEGKHEPRDVLDATRQVGKASSGVDGFGPYWALRSQNFRNGQVNFTMRGCRPELSKWIEGSWNLSQGREVWINDADPTIHFTREEAVAVRAE